MSAPGDGLAEENSRSLRAIAFAMGLGIALLAAVSLYFHARSAVDAPSPQSLKFVNLLTILSMAVTLAGIAASEIAWARLLAGATAEDVNAKTRLSFIVRAALREGPALLGTVTFFLACQDGVLRAYPAYWVDLVPAGLFWSFLYVHWPSLENLKAELEQTLSSPA